MNGELGVSLFAFHSLSQPMFGTIVVLFENISCVDFGYEGDEVAAKFKAELGFTEVSFDELVYERQTLPVML